MPFIKPQEVRRSFKKGVAPVEVSVRPGGRNNQRFSTRSDFWPRGRLDYEFLDRCKELVCRIPHPTNYMRYRAFEYRLSILPWSRGAYVDIRMYRCGTSTQTGLLLHLDVISKLLPELTSVVRRLEMEDMRDPEQKAKVEVITS